VYIKGIEACNEWSVVTLRCGQTKTIYNLLCTWASTKNKRFFRHVRDKERKQTEFSSSWRDVETVALCTRNQPVNATTNSLLLAINSTRFTLYDHRSVPPLIQSIIGGFHHAVDLIYWFSGSETEMRCFYLQAVNWLLRLFFEHRQQRQNTLWLYRFIRCAVNYERYLLVFTADDVVRDA
jgi:hypothetical protein